MNPPSTIWPVLLTEPPALDLVNTRMYVGENWVDLLDHPEQRAEWLRAHAERLDLDLGESAFTDRAAAALRAVRADAAAAVEPARHGRRPPATALAGLNRVIGAAPAAPQARWDGAALIAETRRTGPFADRLAATFAEATVRLLTGPDIGKVRLCDAPACVMLFLARNPNRRWCMPSICGNRARVARYYLRHKPDPGDAVR
ncbi:CGNR zinc finger domain-containing protein [Nocardioides insulae]|uniref:CGNR zinc finger domain-containing protein n=1 Tax=Nocardioides insulae TaxID=394734 RepID=UPI0006849463|nr:ABATE domain-containing protein [Nocardioides insulae]